MTTGGSIGGSMGGSTGGALPSVEIVPLIVKSTVYVAMHPPERERDYAVSFLSRHGTSATRGCEFRRRSVINQAQHPVFVGVVSQNGTHLWLSVCVAIIFHYASIAPFDMR